ncbi:hypothetical protein HMPREF9554_02176 [Treponema phagedenis F0421]|nr:hypothetical protein HMPREF9554_02176 [Treponema phagedenis F0421]
MILQTDISIKRRFWHHAENGRKLTEKFLKGLSNLCILTKEIK